jgi:hypothetical protein
MALIWDRWGRNPSVKDAGLAGDRVHQGQECDPTLLASMAKGNAISWGSTRARGYFVSTVGRDGAVIREYIPEARAGGPAPGSDESMALTSHRQVASRLWGRVSGPIVASSGHITKAPALPEDTYLAEQNEHDCRSDPLLRTTHAANSGRRQWAPGSSAPTNVDRPSTQISTT